MDPISYKNVYSASSRFRRPSFLVDGFIKPILVIFAGGVAAAIPVTAFYYLWAWCMEQVPLASEWAGLIKIGVTLVMLVMGGGVTVWLAIFGGIATMAILATLLD